MIIEELTSHMIMKAASQNVEVNGLFMIRRGVRVVTIVERCLS